MNAIHAALFAFVAGAFAGCAAPIVWRFAAVRRAKRAFIEYVRPVFGRPSTLSPIERSDVGVLIHRVLKDQENGCERNSVARLPRMGQKVPACYEMIGRCVGLLDAFSSCAWKCSEGDHILERLVVRANNSARGAVRLGLMGFYDESLTLVRSVGEIANLLSLFSERRELFERWKTLDERMRRREFSPVEVRKALEQVGTPIRVSTSAYGELSSRAVHVNPGTSPQTFDAQGRPKGASYYQDAGLMVCLNELAQALTFVTYASAQLSHLEADYKKRLFKAGRDLILNTGSIGIDNLQEMWAELERKRAEIQAAI